MKRNKSVIQFFSFILLMIQVDAHASGYDDYYQQLNKAKTPAEKEAARVNTIGKETAEEMGKTLREQKAALQARDQKRIAEQKEKERKLEKLEAEAKQNPTEFAEKHKSDPKLSIKSNQKQSTGNNQPEVSTVGSNSKKSKSSESATSAPTPAARLILKPEDMPPEEMHFEAPTKPSAPKKKK